MRQNFVRTEIFALTSLLTALAVLTALAEVTRLRKPLLRYYRDGESAESNDGVLCKIMYGLATCDLATILSVISDLLGKLFLFPSCTTLCATNSVSH